MDVTLSQTIPAEDGYYLVKFGSQGGLHLVIIKTNEAGRKEIFTDGNKKLFIHDFPTCALWSSKINV